MDFTLSKPGARTRAFLPLALLAGAAGTLTAVAYWPGLMTWDSVRSYRQALSGEIDDWHPPVMAWLWRLLHSVDAGPAPMLLLQLCLYWGGLLLLAAAALKRRRTGLAWTLLGCGLLPLGIALTGMILKDCLMAGALLVATGLLAFGGGAPFRVASGAMLLFAATLRFNAFPACLPLLLALLPVRWRDTWPKNLAASLLASAVILSATPLCNRLIGAKPSGVELSLVIFDLGGITERSGLNVFPEELEVADPVRINRDCYSPNKWDSYSDWVAPECPLGFTAWNDNVDPQEVRPDLFWMRAILAHPIAYAEHRLRHFAVNSRLLPLSDTIERPVPASGAPNLWGFRVRPSAAIRCVDTLAMATAHGPLGWPIVYLGLALGTFFASRGLPGAWLIRPIALSSLLYGGGYLFFSVASELRYHLWTELAALIAAALLIDDLRGGNRRRLLWAIGPAAIAMLAAVIARVMS